MLINNKTLNNNNSSKELKRENILFIKTNTEENSMNSVVIHKNFMKTSFASNKKCSRMLKNNKSNSNRINSSKMDIISMISLRKIIKMLIGDNNFRSSSSMISFIRVLLNNGNNSKISLIRIQYV